MPAFADEFLSQVSPVVLTGRAAALCRHPLKINADRFKAQLTPGDRIHNLLFETDCPMLPQLEKNKSWEQTCLNRMGEALDLMQDTKSGALLLSRLPTDVRFCVMRQPSNGSFNRSENLIILSSSRYDYWHEQCLFIKTFAHEMAHAWHDKAQRVILGPCDFSPKACFLNETFDEVGARLTGEQVYGEIVRKLTGSYRAQSSPAILKKMKAAGYFEQYADVALPDEKAKIEALNEDNQISAKLKKLFAFYGAVYPQMMRPAFLNTVEKLYQEHVTKRVICLKNKSAQKLR